MLIYHFHVDNSKLEILHVHSYIELLYHVHGNAKITLSKGNYFISKGDFIIINSNVEHSRIAIFGNRLR